MLIVTVLLSSCLLTAVDVLVSGGNPEREGTIEVPIPAIDDDPLHRYPFEAYIFDGKAYVRVYMTVFNDDPGWSGGTPIYKDIWQSDSKYVIYYTKDEKLWVSFGYGRRQIMWVKKYLEQGSKKEITNRPLIHSVLVDADVVIQISKNALPEKFSTKRADINVDVTMAPNQFGLSPESVETLRQNTLVGSLVTYYTDEDSLRTSNDNQGKNLKDKWGKVEKLDVLLEQYGYPDFRKPFPRVKNSERLTSLIEQYRMGGTKQTDAFYKKYKAEGGKRNVEYFYETLVPEMATQLKLSEIISENSRFKQVNHESLRQPEFHKQILPGIDQDPVSKVKGYEDFPAMSEHYKELLISRAQVLQCTEELGKILRSQLLTAKGHEKKAFEEKLNRLKQLDSDLVKLFLAQDLTTEDIRLFIGELEEIYPENTELSLNTVLDEIKNHIEGKQGGDLIATDVELAISHDDQVIGKEVREHRPLLVESSRVTILVDGSHAPAAEKITAVLRERYLGGYIDTLELRATGFGEQQALKWISEMNLELKERKNGKSPAYEERSIDIKKVKVTVLDGFYELHPHVDYVSTTFNGKGGFLNGPDKNGVYKMEEKKSLKKDQSKDAGNEQVKVKALKDAANQELSQKVKDAIPSCRRGRRALGSFCASGKNKYLVDKETIKLTEDGLKFKVFEEHEPSFRHEVYVHIEPEEMPSLSATRKSFMSEIHKGLGVHGSLINLFAALHYFEKGDNVRGGISLYQSAHSTGQLLGVNDAIGEAINNVLDKEATKYANLALKRAIKEAEKGNVKLSEMLTKFSKRLRQAARLGELVPWVNVAFDAYFISEDIKNLVENKDHDLDLMYEIDLGLDIASSVLATVGALGGPEAEAVVEPFILVLTLLRMTIDDIYMDILEEWRRASGKGTTAHIDAIISGLAMGLGDAFTLGLFRQMRLDAKQEATNLNFLRNMSKPDNYFEVFGEGNGTKTVNFADGIMSQYGGFITVKLLDNGNFTLQIYNVATESGPRTLQRTFPGNVSNIVLGVGESIILNKEGLTEAYLWMVIPVKSYKSFNYSADESSAHGRYYGNSEDNAFFALQGNHSNTKQNECLDTVQPDEWTVRLDHYKYDLYGKGGDDSFYLGPQGSYTEGGEGHDSYNIPWYVGSTIINNFAMDRSLDVVHINVSYRNIKCQRQGSDLLISHCNRQAILIRNWFHSAVTDYYGHVIIVSNDGVALMPGNSTIKSNHSLSYHCVPVRIDKSFETVGQTVDISQRVFQEVMQVVGTNFSDTIIGNGLGNTISGGLGNDVMMGGEGKDVYIIPASSGCDSIDNTALDNATDTIVFDANFTNIDVRKFSSFSVLVRDVTDRKSCFIVVDRAGFSRDHKILIISADQVIFEIIHNADTGRAEKKPFILDYSTSDDGMNINLGSRHRSNGLLAEDAERIITIIDSKSDDRITANNRTNFLSCSGGKDYLAGMGGYDVYVVQKGCSSVNISNYDTEMLTDTLILKFPFSALSVQELQSEHLMLSNEQSKSQRVILLHWFHSKQYRHLIIKTEDGITASLPSSLKQYKRRRITPTEIMLSEKECHKHIVTFDLNENIWQGVQMFRARSGQCLCRIMGNGRDNYINPGPGNPSGYQYMQGGNGSDTYVVEYDYGQFNSINNTASDLQMDYLETDILYRDLVIEVAESDLIIASANHSRGLISARILNFMDGQIHQHLTLITYDGFMLLLTPHYPHLTILAVDKSKSWEAVIISRNMTEMAAVRSITGAQSAKNIIWGQYVTEYIGGGQLADVLHGGSTSVVIQGFAGADEIYGGIGYDMLSGGPGDDLLHGGDGDDALYGGQGADVIYGGPGSDTVAFAGNGSSQTGVHIDLLSGKGLQADAEGDSYYSIENVLGTEYDDRLYGTNDDNIMKGFNGEDYLHPFNGNDILDGGLGLDVFNCSNVDGKKEIWLDGNSSYSEVIIMDGAASTQICYFYAFDDLVIVGPTDTPHNVLELVVKDFNANLSKQNFDITFTDMVHSASFFFDACRLDEDIDSFRTFFWLYILDYTESEVIINFNASGTALLSGCNTSVEFQYSNDFSGTTLMDLPASNRSGGIMLIENLLPAVWYRFSMHLTKCGVVVTSKTVWQYTLPAIPTNLQVLKILPDSVSLNWSVPVLQESQRNLYSFVVHTHMSNHTRNVSLGNDGQGTITAYTHHSSIIIDSLLFDTHYEILVASSVFGMLGGSSEPLFVHTPPLCNHTVLENGFIKAIQHTNRGELVTVACRNGYWLKGNDTFLCHEKAPICTPKSCHLVLTNLTDLNICAIRTRINQTAFPSGTKIQGQCCVNFELEDQQTVFDLTCVLGEWQPEPTACREIETCTMPSLPDPLLLELLLFTGTSIVSHEPFGNFPRLGTHRLLSRNDRVLRHLNQIYDRLRIWYTRTLDVNYSAFRRLKRLFDRLLHRYPQPLRKGTVLEASCRHGFALHGPTEVRCEGRTWTRFPSCIPLVCPAPPQVTNGHYRSMTAHANTSFTEHEKTYLFCDKGFLPGKVVQLINTLDDYQIMSILRTYPPSAEEFARNATYKNKILVTCSDGRWFPESDQCIPLTSTTPVSRTVFGMISRIRFSFGQQYLRNDRLRQSIHKTICDEKGLMYKPDLSNIDVVHCSRPVKLMDGPTVYSGVPTAIVHKEWKRVCFDDSSIRDQNLRDEWCSHLGYSKYTNTFYRGSPYTADLEPRCNQSGCYLATRYNKACRTYLMCRAMCSDMRVSNGHGCEKPQGHWFEGETCQISCNTNYVRVGNGVVTCTSNGWTQSPDCVRSVTRRWEVWEGSQKTMQCEGAQYVEIQRADYYADCSVSYKNFIPFYGYVYAGYQIDCRVKGFCDQNIVTHRAMSICSNQQQCTMRASSSIFGDPCPVLSKKLKVSWKCIN